MVGYGRQLFTFRKWASRFLLTCGRMLTPHSWYWLYSPVLGGFTGGMLGATLYDVFLYGDRENGVSRL